MTFLVIEGARNLYHSLWRIPMVVLERAGIDFSGSSLFHWVIGIKTDVFHGRLGLAPAPDLDLDPMANSMGVLERAGIICPDPEWSAVDSKTFWQSRRKHVFDARAAKMAQELLANGEFHRSFWSAPASTFLERAYFTGRSGSRRTCSTGRLGLAPAPDLDMDLRKVAPPISADST